MNLNRESTRFRVRAAEPSRTARPANRGPEVPQITIRGDNNLISLGSSGAVSMSTGSGAASPSQPLPNGHWPQQILDAIRLKAGKDRRSNDRICELAGRVLGRPIVTLDRLNTRELARVYEAVCATASNSR
jgi:hypothetical protein